MYLADTLSRAYLQSEERSTVEIETESINMIDFLSVSEATREQIQNSTNEDLSCQNLKRFITEGWPEDKRLLPAGTNPYFHIRDELSIQDGIIFKGLRCVIPASLRMNIKTKLHNAHTGIESTLRRARDTVYWPGMSKELKDYVEQCSICNSYRTQQPKEPLISHEIPDHTGEKVGVDIFTLDGTDYLCIVDYFSDYFDVDKRSNKKDAPAVIKILRRYFSAHGIPVKVQSESDNGPPFLLVNSLISLDHISSTT